MAPTIARDGKFRLFFVSREEQRIHVHVAHPDGAKQSSGLRPRYTWRRTWAYPRYRRVERRLWSTSTFRRLKMPGISSFSFDRAVA
jgi:hypothetical protein